MRRQNYTFWHQFNEKSNFIPGCSGILQHAFTLTNSTSDHETLAHRVSNAHNRLQTNTLFAEILCHTKHMHATHAARMRQIRKYQNLFLSLQDPKENLVYLWLNSTM